jgi:hypothetical protein
MIFSEDVLQNVLGGLQAGFALDYAHSFRAALMGVDEKATLDRIATAGSSLVGAHRRL